jgi:hypothetical protein
MTIQCGVYKALGFAIPVQILRFWTLSIVLSLSKTSSCLSFKTQHFGDWSEDRD